MDFKIDIKPTLLNEIQDYCKVNNIDDFNGFINKLMDRGFNYEKYGDKPINNIRKGIVKNVNQKSKPEISVNKVQDPPSAKTNINNIYGE